MRATRGWWLGLTLALFGCGDDAPCDPGTLGCPCLLDGVCRVDGLSCIEGLCVDGAAGDPKCYSPCVTDMLLEDGSVRVCSEEGLVDGCLEGQTCALGSCVRDSVLAQSGSALSAIGRCEVETDCPDFQTCAGGRCISNCEHHSDCSSDQVCSKKVCRQRCTEVTPCSTDTQACSFLGACIPLTRASAPIQTPVEGGFSLDATRIDFSTSRLQREITITNRGESEETFIVRKLEERTLDRSGNLSTVLASEGEAPLFWLWMGVGTPRQVQQIPVTVRGGGSETIVLSEPRNPAFNSWTGVLEVESERYGRTRVDLRYSEEVQGRWAGHAYYFGNFETNAALEAWRMDRRNTAAIDAVPNAFLQAWARFRNNQIDLAQMEALVQTTLTGSWAFPRVKELCEEAGYGSSTACAPFGGVGSAAVIPYTSAANVNRIPSGVVELNFVAHLRPASFEEQADPTQCGRPGLQAGSPEHCFVGRIESNQALQYGANPALTLRFEQSPLECQTSGITGCVSYLADFASEVMVGGRYLRPPSDRTCELGGEGMTPFATPWLVPGFSASGGGDERVECRDQRVPFDDAAGNTFYAGANPIPDGRSRRRRLELIDGAVVDQQVMMLIVREVTPSFDGGPDLESYAYITLTKDSSDLEPEDTRGNRPRDERAPPEGLLDAGCDAALINEAIRRPNRTLASLSSRDRESLAWAMVTGATSNSAITVSNPALESIHTLCVWNEDTVVQSNPSGLDSVTTQTRQLFDAGPDGSVSCPAGSRIIYFALAAGAVDAAGAAIDPAADPCNRNANGAPEACFATLREWVAQGVRIRLMPRDEADFADAPSATSFDLAWTCTPPGFGSTDPNAPPVAAVPISTTASCEDDRRDLLSGKTFFAAAQGQLVYNPLETDIHQAFRYRTQFVSPSGRPGFAPVVCRGESGLVPYCYDAEQIEAVLGRATCALALYDFDQAASPAEQISTDARVMLLEYLRKSFGVLQVDNPVGDPILQQGLERLYAELLITLGDDAYTSSFASRFDIAGAAELAFEGSRFEAGGIDVSGRSASSSTSSTRPPSTTSGSSTASSRSPPGCGRTPSAPSRTATSPRRR
ncbi:MAG: hypothetical protein H6730_21510 [Deltaproteobacteria bacterium]|nr:hypothetical protein [Deltaproteobacteria bacterium]